MAIMGQPIQHHFPAVLIGEFGEAGKKKRAANRERLVWVAQRGSPKIVRVRAAKVGYQRSHARLYDVSLPEGHFTIDDRWALVESRVPQLVRALEKHDRRGIPRELFVRVLVGLVSQLMVRHPEYEARYLARAAAVGDFCSHLVSDQTGWAVNLAREIDILCLSGVLIDSQWWLLSSIEPFVGSDLGFAGGGIRFDAEQHHGYFFPLSPNLAVYIGNGTPNFDVDAPFVFLNRRLLTREEAHEMNTTIAAWAPVAVFARQEPSVTRAAQIWAQRNEDPPLRSDVPNLLFAERSPPPPGQMERWLRTMHRAQELDQPWDSSLVDFENCSRCQGHMADITLWTSNRLSAEG
jgi:hypothetical protein